jgi:uncharacterized membrane protein (UPF0127 family)
VETLPPGKIGPFVPRARWVLETNAGEAARLGIAPGQRLASGPSSDPSPDPSPDPGASE